MKGVVFSAILACCLLAASAQTPKKCCIDTDQFSAKLTNLTSINSKAVVISDLQMDFTKKQQAMQQFIYDPVSKTSNVTGRNVFDFTKDILYYIPANAPNTCYKIRSGIPQIRCIPDDAEYLGSSYLGPMAGSTPYDGWRFKAGTIMVTIAMTKTGCVPLVEGVSAPGNDQLYLFTTFQPKLTNPDLFKLPDSCFK